MFRRGFHGGGSIGSQPSGLYGRRGVDAVRYAGAVPQRGKAPDRRHPGPAGPERPPGNGPDGLRAQSLWNRRASPCQPFPGILVGRGRSLAVEMRRSKRRGVLDGWPGKHPPVSRQDVWPDSFLDGVFGWSSGNGLFTACRALPNKRYPAVYTGGQRAAGFPAERPALRKIAGFAFSQSPRPAGNRRGQGVSGRDSSASAA